LHEGRAVATYRVSLLRDVQHKNLLFDFYGALLTDKQRVCFALFYMDDLSLAEIGERSGTTPQAVADLLKRSCMLLEGYERKLGLVGKHAVQTAQAERLYILLAKIKESLLAAGKTEEADLADAAGQTLGRIIE
jgi:hypothetical protein